MPRVPRQPIPTRPRGGPARPVADPQPVAAPVSLPAPPPMPQPMDETGVSPLMISSLPAMASGADVYARQFYRAGSKIPQRRFLPVVYQ